MHGLLGTRDAVRPSSNHACRSLARIDEERGFCFTDDTVTPHSSQRTHPNAQRTLTNAIALILTDTETIVMPSAKHTRGTSSTWR